jgi:hypothetical protein
VSILIKKNINLLKKINLFKKKKKEEEEEKRAGLGWLGHPLAPIFVFCFFFFNFFFKKISIFIYFLINLYYFIKIGHVSATCHQ